VLLPDDSVTQGNKTEIDARNLQNLEMKGESMMVSHVLNDDVPSFRINEGYRVFLHHAI
jgi:hypothetical protein